MPRSKAYSEDIVLNRAMMVFWNHGYKATSVRLLEKEMGINQFSIYASFSNKKNLFIESIRKYGEHVKQNVFYSLLQKDAGLAELKAFLQNTALGLNTGNGTKKGCLVVNTATEIGNKDNDIVREINRYYDFIRGMLKTVLQNAIAKGEVPPDTDVEKQSSFFLGIMQGLSVATKTMDQNQLNDFISIALKQTQ